MTTGTGSRPAVDARAGAKGTRLDLDGVCRWFGSDNTVIKPVDGTVTGVAAGYGLLAWLTATTVPSVMLKIAVSAAVSAGTIAAAVLLGTAVVAASSLFTVRRLRRTGIPATLRVVE